MRRVLVNTHSPYFVQFHHAEDLLLAIPATTRSGGPSVTTVRLLPVAGTWRPATHGAVLPAEIVDHSSNPPGAQLALDLEGIAS